MCKHYGLLGESIVVSRSPEGYIQIVIENDGEGIASCDLDDLSALDVAMSIEDLLGRIGDDADD